MPCGWVIDAAVGFPAGEIVFHGASRNFWMFSSPVPPMRVLPQLQYHARHFGVSLDVAEVAVFGTVWFLTLIPDRDYLALGGVAGMLSR